MMRDFLAGNAEDDAFDDFNEFEVHRDALRELSISVTNANSNAGGPGNWLSFASWAVPQTGWNFHSIYTVPSENIILGTTNVFGTLASATTFTTKPTAHIETTSPWAKGIVDPSPTGTPIQPGTQIPLNTLFTYSPDTTSFDVRVRTNGGGYLIDPNGHELHDNSIHSGSLSQIGQWKFVASNTAGRDDLIGFDAINSSGTSNATSVVATGSSIVEGIDWPFEISSANALSVKNAGYQFVVRYYHNDSSGLDNLTDSERVNLVNANLQICTVWENKSNQQNLGIGAFSNGASDATAAIAEAKLAHQDAGSAIYFAVDLNVVSSISTIEQYFGQINSIFSNSAINDQHYKIGVYGSGYVCSAVVADGNASYAWLASAAYNWQGTSGDNSWNISQVGTTDSLTVPMSNLDPNSRIQVGNLLGVDIDLANSANGGFGAFGGASPPGVSFPVSTQTGVEGGTLTFRISIDNPNYAAVSDYRIYYNTADGTATAGSDYTGIANQVAVDFTVNSPQYIDVQVSTLTDSNSNEGTESFNFNVYDYQHNLLEHVQGNITDATPPPDAYTADANTTGVVTPGGGQIGSNLETVGDRDWFKMQVVQGYTYTVHLDSGSPPQLGPFLSDPEVYIYDSSSQLRYFDDDSGAGLNSQLTFTAAYSGFYFVGAAASGDNGTGTYRVTVSAGTDTTAPSLINGNPLFVTTGGSVTITSSRLLSDDNGSAHAQETYTVINGPAHGSLLKSGVVTGSFTQADIDNGLITYHEDGSNVSSDAFTFRVTDAAGNQTISYQFNFNIEDATPPSLVNETSLSVANGGSGTIASSLLRFDDNVSTHSQEIYTVINGPAHGLLLKSGVATGSFTQADIDNGLITYHEDGSNVSSDSFTFRVTDAAGNQTSGQQFNFNISTPLPDLSVTNVVLNGTTLNFTIHNLGGGVAAASTTGLYLSTDSNITAADTLLMTQATPSIAAGSSGNEHVTLSFSGGQSAGTYYIGALADYNGTVAESRGDNNASNSVPIILGDNNANALYATAGADHIFGLSGNDTIDMGANLTVADNVDGGAGYDSVTLNGDYSAGVTFNASTMVNVESVNLTAGHSYKLTTHDATVATDQIVKIDGSTLGAADVLTFNGSHEIDGRFNVLGGAAADRLIGGAGNDTLSGGAGNDVLTLSYGGNDTANGGDGNDTFTMAAAFTSSDRIDGGTGTDVVTLNGDYSAGVSFAAATMVNVEKITVAAGHSYKLTTNSATVAAGQILKVDGSALGATDVLTFNGSHEIDGRFSIIGGAGSDALYGGAGADTINGGAGNDTLNLSYGGNDVASGGDGNDTFSMGTTFTTSDKLDGGADIDIVTLSGDYSVGVSFGASTMINVEDIKLTAGHSYKLVTNDTTVAASQTLKIDGSVLGASDVLTFNGSHETNGRFNIIGGVGKDTLTGGAGDDTFTGGGGLDVITGNGGADTFVYSHIPDSTGTTHDIIKGFDASVDKFDFSFAVTAIDTTVASGVLSAGSFDTDLSTAIGANQLGLHHAVLFTPNSGDLHGHILLIVNADSSAGYQAGHDLVFDITGASNLANLSTGDFI